MSSKEVDGLKTLNALLERDVGQLSMDLCYLADLLMRATGCGPQDTLETAIERAQQSNARMTVSNIGT
jgi:hypothetical protein